MLRLSRLFRSFSFSFSFPPLAFPVTNHSRICSPAPDRKEPEPKRAEPSLINNARAQSRRDAIRSHTSGLCPAPRDGILHRPPCAVHPVRSSPPLLSSGFGVLPSKQTQRGRCESLRRCGQSRLLWQHKRERALVRRIAAQSLPSPETSVRTGKDSEKDKRWQCKSSRNAVLWAARSHGVCGAVSSGRAGGTQRRSGAEGAGCRQSLPALPTLHTGHDAVRAQLQQHGSALCTEQARLQPCSCSQKQSPECLQSLALASQEAALQAVRCGSDHGVALPVIPININKSRVLAGALPSRLWQAGCRSNSMGRVKGSQQRGEHWRQDRAG